MESLSQINQMNQIGQIGQIGCLQLSILTFTITSIIFAVLIMLAFHNGLLSFRKEPKFTHYDDKLNIEDTTKYIQLLDKLLLLKFNFYVGTFFSAALVKHKELDKTEIKNIKEQFYIDVSSTLNDHQKNQLLKVFSKKGIEIYIHQTFLKLLNDLDMKFNNSKIVEENDLNDKFTKEIYKG